MTQPDHARAAADAGAHMVGLVFHAASPRALDRKAAERVLEALPPHVQPVALLVNATREHPVLQWWHGHIQLHGDESEADCAAVAAQGNTVMRGFPCTSESLARWDACSAVDLLVLDGPRPGSGALLQMEDLATRLPQLSKRAMLAGGLTPENAAERIRRIRPWGVDVSSGVERTRGVKDAALIAAFCRAVQEADR